MESKPAQSADVSALGTWHGVSSPVRQVAGELHIGGNKIEYWLGGTVRTTFPDGTQLMAHPDGSDDQLATTERLGYGRDVASMVREHEIIHTLIAVIDGKPYCPVLYAAAKGEPLPMEGEAADIEDQVMAGQELLNDPEFKPGLGHQPIWALLRPVAK